MPIVRTFDEGQRRDSSFKFPLSDANSFHPLAITIAVALACASCERTAVPDQTDKTKPLADAHPSPSRKKESRKKSLSKEGYAVWYVVPVDSLANRRAEKGEFTAAHNHLPLGSRVRVTHLKNGHSVIVRITDRGITKRGVSIDLCKPAAEELGIISEGMARVRMEELADEASTSAAPDPKADAANP